MERVELEVITLTPNFSRAHSYAIMLGEKEGSRRLPVIIGLQEAQAIAVALENMQHKRPLTHDVIKTITEKFNLPLKYVIINSLKEGVFYASLAFEHNGNTVEIDSRTSDAIALAVRCECQIFTYKNILDHAGITKEELEKGKVEEIEETVNQADENESEAKPADGNQFQQFTTAQLEGMLDEVLKNEQYEAAAKIRDEIDKRNDVSD